MSENRPQLDRTGSGIGFQGLSAVQRKFTNLRLQRSSTGTSQNEEATEKTRFGLTELHSPTNTPAVDFIFVHGLRGGSIKTWRKYEDPAYYWPKAWIPIDTDFAAVRTSSFGYQSDWLSRKESILNVHEFGRKLLNELQTAPFLRRPGDTSIVFIGHSMGGLVIKKAYLMATRESPEIAARIKTIVFLATPHRGSDSADLLHSILDLTGNQKPFVKDLMKNSLSLQAINDEFRYVSDDLDLWSFFEERKMRVGLKPEFVVGRDSATMGYRYEKIFSLDANHREVCKFESPEDENYVTLRNALVTIVDSLVHQNNRIEDVSQHNQLDAIQSYLNITEFSDADLDELMNLKTAGTCEWIENRDTLQAWLHDRDRKSSLPGYEQSQKAQATRRPPPSKNDCRVYWLTAKPGAGKSVCSAHLVTYLREQDYDCSYFSFKDGIRSKQTLGSMLRSIAFQMARTHERIRTLIQGIIASGTSIDKDSDDAVWRQVFVPGIFRTKLDRPHFWVIDGLDECIAGEKLLLLLTKLVGDLTLRIFVTSRPQTELARGFNRLSSNMTVITDSIRPEDTEGDMQLYLSSDEARLDIDDDAEREQLEKKLLSRSNGCFLWTKLVRYELEGVYLEESIDSVLDEIPSEMSELYGRSLVTISKNVRERKLTQALLTWAVCAWRPLSLAELQAALRFDSDLHVRDLRRSIEGLCCNLLYVDRHDHVQLIHSTLREFLFDTNLESDYAVNRHSGHERLARGCLSFMSLELRPPRNRSLGRSLANKAQGRAVFANYAASFFSEHLTVASSTSDSLLLALAQFLDGNILAWIEYIASEEASLYCLTRTAKNFKQYLERRAKYVSPLGKEFKLMNDWTIDLVRLVAKFGNNLKAQPTSIFFLIPCISPTESQLHRQSLNLPKWLELVGSANTAWDDCVSFIEYRETYATALACGQSTIAIGMKNGDVTLYDQATCQERLTVTHHLPDTKKKQSPIVRLLAFDTLDQHFASAGLQSICVWSIDGRLLHMFEIQEPLVNLIFSMSSSEIIGVTRSSKVSRFKTSDEEPDALTPPAYLERRRSSGYISPQSLKLPKQAPLAAAISPDETVLALLYRGKPIYLYNIEYEQLLGTCGRDSGSSGPNISVLTALFNPNPDSGLLAVSHQDGELAVYDSWTQRELVSVDGDAYSLAATPDGQTLASGNTGGIVRLWDFETLALLYVIRSGLEEVRSLAFTGDGLRLVDRRDTRIKVWEPSALIRRSAEEDSSQSDALTLEAPDVGANNESITTTAMCADERGKYVFAGRSDGAIVAFDTSKADTPVATIHSPKDDTFAEIMAFANDILAVVNSLQTIQVWKIPQVLTSSAAPALLLEKSYSEPVQQLLLRQDGSRLLATTSAVDEMFDLADSGRGRTVFPSLSNRSRRWLSLNDHIAVIDSVESIKLYSWDTIEAAELYNFPLGRTNDSADTRASTVIESFLQSQSGSYVVAVLKSSYPSRSRAEVEVWIHPSASLALGLNLTTSGAMLPTLDLPPNNVHTFLGVYEEQVVFIDHDLWICSIKLDEISANKPSDIIRHIFIPPEFVGGSTVAKPFVTQQGHLILNKEDKVAIIKGALDWSFT